MTRILLAVWLTIVVDQVDGPVALVEWGPQIFGTVATDVLPPDTGEGDRLQVLVRRRDLRVLAAHQDTDDFDARVRRTRPVPRSSNSTIPDPSTPSTRTAQQSTLRSDR